MYKYHRRLVWVPCDVRPNFCAIFGDEKLAFARWNYRGHCKLAVNGEVGFLVIGLLYRTCRESHQTRRFQVIPAEGGCWSWHFVLKRQVWAGFREKKSTIEYKWGIIYFRWLYAVWGCTCKQGQSYRKSRKSNFYVLRANVNPGNDSHLRYGNE